MYRKFNGLMGIRGLAMRPGEEAAEQYWGLKTGVRFTSKDGCHRHGKHHKNALLDSVATSLFANKRSICENG